MQSWEAFAQQLLSPLPLTGRVLVVYGGTAAIVHESNTQLQDISHAEVSRSGQ